MKTLYLDCGMGAAGDMLTAALIELLPDPAAFVRELNELGIPGVEFKKEASVKCGITGTHMTVTWEGAEEESHDHDYDHAHDHAHEHHHDHEHDHAHEHHHDHEHDHAHEHHHDHEHEHEHDHGHAHHHSGLHEIEHIIEHLPVSSAVRADILSVYSLIAEAESAAHGVPVTEIHFHEVGTMDAIADVTAVCLLMERLQPDQIIVSPVHVGSGHVHCAHGILPVPAPATAYILKDAPIYGGRIRGELCTPTGAALLKHFATRFGDMPVMKTTAIGYGMGKKDFEMANCVRAMLGETEDSTGEAAELSCNIDDMTAEAIGFAMDRLYDAGALEVYTTAVGMKKNRPGVVLSALCRMDDREKIAREIFKYTTTIGIRENVMKRYMLWRKSETVETEFGPVRKKTSTGYGVTREKYEYDDISRIAKAQGISVAEVLKRIK